MNWFVEFIRTNICHVLTADKSATLARAEIPASAQAYLCRSCCKPSLTARVGYASVTGCLTDDDVAVFSLCVNMSDGHTGITDELDNMDVGSTDDDAVLEWDYSADVTVEPPPSSSSSAYELTEYIVSEFVPINKRKHAKRLINVWKVVKVRL